MPIYTKSYLGQVGSYFITDPALSNVTILRVARNDLIFNRTLVTAGNMQFVYHVGPGKIAFDPSNPFSGPAPDLPVGINDLEKVQVKYRV